MTGSPQVYNQRRPHPPDAVRVDRQTVFGNPFEIGLHGTRADVIEKYERWIWLPEQLELRRRMIRELRGRDLLCWCAPLACHADVILSIANCRVPPDWSAEMDQIWKDDAAELRGRRDAPTTRAEET